MIKLKLVPALFLILFLAHCSSTQPVTTNPPVATVSDTLEPETPPVEETPPAEEPVELTAPPTDWHHQSDADGGLRGIGTAKAYEMLLKDKEPGRTVVVAVIDGGTDVEHEDLKDHIWVNEDEIAGNGKDDDENGYVDDINGWNFIGGADGENVSHDTYEVTREYAKLKAKYGDINASDVPEAEREAYQHYLEIEAAYDEKRADSEQQYSNIGGFANALEQAASILKPHLGVEEITKETLARVDESQPMLSQAKQIYTFLFDNNITEQDLFDYKEHLETDLNYRFNLDFDPRGTVGDNYGNTNERSYGNADVIGPDADHGTHVAGIIAATRGNDNDSDGVATPVQIMVVRTVPDGDERDKDVANAIRYAADNGAHVINMSFGKAFSPEKSVVDEAVQYADSKGVLLIHAAGNDGKNIDEENNFPNRDYLDGGQAANWLEIGASSWKLDNEISATFSNYGKTAVDVFAPGVAVYSTLPNQEYGPQDGTSMAAPVVSGVAALLMAYYPDLTAAQVREIIIQSAVSYSDKDTTLPGSEGELVPFGDLSVTGSIVNVYEALKMAESQVQ